MPSDPMQELIEAARRLLRTAEGELVDAEHALGVRETRSALSNAETHLSLLALGAVPEGGEERGSSRTSPSAAPSGRPDSQHSAGGLGTYQTRVHDWMMACFGQAIADDPVERSFRFLEEALELVQAQGCTAEEALRLVEYVFGRPVGEPRQEVGGVAVCLAALCTAAKIDLEAAAETELARVWTKVEKIRAKHASKPQGVRSSLPGGGEPTPAESSAISPSEASAGNSGLDEPRPPALPYSAASRP